jgi:phosphoenolpyruvate phosphomutase / 2-hydroxyethylphosphonate cytidylyltransferase
MTVKKAVILAGGLSLRMGNAALGSIKCLLPLEKNESILERTVRLLKRNGVNDVVLVVGYSAHDIKKKLNNSVRYIEEPLYTKEGMLDSLYYAAEEFNEPFLFMYADSVFSERALKKIINSEKGNMVGLVSDKESDDEAEKVKFQNNNIIRCSKKIPNTEADAQFTGIIKFEKEGAVKLRENLQYLKVSNSIEKKNLRDAITIMADKGEQIKAEHIQDEDWMEIDFPEEYEYAKNQFLTRINKIDKVEKESIQPRNRQEKLVYVPIAVDTVHIGHIRLIKKAKELGKVVIGLLTDKAIAKYQRIPLFDYEQRKTIIENIGDVDEVIQQDSWDYTENLKELKPDYVVHSDDWKTGMKKEKREIVLQTIKEWGGELVEVHYKDEFPREELDKNLIGMGVRPEIRRNKLRRLLNAKETVRILEAHNGLSALVVENTRSKTGSGHAKEFDGIWISSLTDSTAKGKPDTELVDSSSRLNTIEQILEVTTKPLIVDGDTGGRTEHFVFTVRSLERLGVSAIVIEDKIGPKRNSLFGTEVNQTQDSIENFSHKINQGKKAQLTNSFMIVARVESLILKKGAWDALLRARAYIEAGADAIMIHSKESKPDEILEFCQEFQKLENKVPLVVVPSTYNQITERELTNAGVNIVIYANHLLRSAYPAMKKTAESILANERSYEAGEMCLPIKEVLTLIPGGK